eukprot:137889-Rhodomonas_salina.4
MPLPGRGECDRGHVVRSPARYTAKSNTRNRITGKNCTERRFLVFDFAVYAYRDRRVATELGYGAIGTEKGIWYYQLGTVPGYGATSFVLRLDLIPFQVSGFAIQRLGLRFRIVDCGFWDRNLLQIPPMGPPQPFSNPTA